jgi:hypothetical protein
VIGVTVQPTDVEVEDTVVTTVDDDCVGAVVETSVV